MFEDLPAAPPQPRSRKHAITAQIWPKRFCPCLRTPRERISPSAGKEGNIKLAEARKRRTEARGEQDPTSTAPQGPARRERTSASGARGRPRRGLERSRCPDERPGGRQGLSVCLSLSLTHSNTVCPAARDVWRREKGHHAVSKPTAESFLGAANAGGQGGSHGHVCF